MSQPFLFVSYFLASIHCAPYSSSKAEISLPHFPSVLGSRDRKHMAKELKELRNRKLCDRCWQTSCAYILKQAGTANNAEMGKIEACSTLGF